MSYKGYKMSAETRRKMSNSHLGKTFTLEHRRNIGSALTGRELSLETRAILSGIASQRILTEKHKAKIGDSMRGNKHHNWKGGVTYPIFALRKTKEYRHWRNAVLERDGHRCTECSTTDTRLDAHHIKSFTHYPELRFEVSNGKTVCISCHTKIGGNFE